MVCFIFTIYSGQKMELNRPELTQDYGQRLEPPSSLHVQNMIVYHLLASSNSRTIRFETVRTLQEFMYSWSKEAFMDIVPSKLLEQYLTSYLGPVTDYTLLVDYAPAHTTSSLRALLEVVHPVCTPRECTPLLQPLGVEINKVF